MFGTLICTYTNVLYRTQIYLPNGTAHDIVCPAKVQLILIEQKNYIFDVGIEEIIYTLCPAKCSHA